MSYKRFLYILVLLENYSFLFPKLLYNYDVAYLIVNFNFQKVIEIYTKIWCRFKKKKKLNIYESKLTQERVWALKPDRPVFKS